MEESDVGETNLEATSPFLIQHHVAAESRLAILKLCHKALWVTKVQGLLTIFCAGRQKKQIFYFSIGRRLRQAEDCWNPGINSTLQHLYPAFGEE